MEKTLDKKTLKERYQDVIPLFKEEKVQSFTTLVLTLIAFLIFGLFAINPTIATIVQLRKQLSDSKFVLEKLQEKINDLKILQDQYAQLDQDLLGIFKAMPNAPTVPLLAGQIHALAEKNHLALTRLQVLQVELATGTGNNQATKKEGSRFGSFSFTLDIEGTTADIENFISSFINFERIITIDSLSVTNNPEKNTISQLNIRGKAYFKQ